MRNLLVFTVFIIVISACYSQKTKEGNFWYFGEYAGLDFNSGKPVALDDGAMCQLEGCSTISDTSGRLLFYSDGVIVWNRNHRVMNMGAPLSGDYSSCQSALFVPMPGNTSMYYLFTQDQKAGQKGFRYSTIDKSLDGGLGGIVDTNIFINYPVTEKLAATHHKNKKDVWIVVHGWQNNAFYAYRLTENGLDMNPVVSYCGKTHWVDLYGDSVSAIGDMRISADGSRLALTCHSLSLLEIFDFNNETGVVSNAKTLVSKDYYHFWGLELSDNGTKLYVGDYDSKDDSTRLYQFDISKPVVDEIKQSMFVLRTNAHGPSMNQLQMAPDGKIYVVRSSEKELACISYPEAPGVLCGFVDSAVSLGNGICMSGLPNFVSSYFNHCDHWAGYYTFSGVKDIHLVGTATVEDSVVRLTKNTAYEKGALWLDSAYDLSEGFIARLKFRMYKGSNNSAGDNSVPGADGIALVIQTQGPKALGIYGGGIGYDGINNALAVEFDLFSNNRDHVDNLSDITGNHVALMTGGRGRKVSSNHRNCLAQNNDIITMKSDSTVYSAKIVYNSKSRKLSVFLDTNDEPETLVLEYNNIDLTKVIDLIDGKKAYIGITSATGLAYQFHEILALNVCLGL